eukprot:4166466-Pleurochrysis_carterae.AAC.2
MNAAFTPTSLAKDKLIIANLGDKSAPRLADTAARELVKGAKARKHTHQHIITCSQQSGNG